jgi:transcriptional regulator with XRE-family HTH domain
VSTLSRIERGMSDPSISTAERIARALGLSLAEVLEVD